MININKVGKITTLILFICLLPSWIYADRITKGDVYVDYELLADGTYKVIDVYNNSSKQIRLFVDKNSEIIVNAHSSAKVNKTARRVSLDYDGNGYTLLQYKAPSTPKIEEEISPEKNQSEKSSPSSNPSNPAPASNLPNSSNRSNTTDIVEHDIPKESSIPRQDLGGNSSAAFDYIDRDAYFGKDAVASFIQKIDSYNKELAQSDNAAQLITNHDIKKFIIDSETEINLKEKEIPNIAKDAVLISGIKDSAAQNKMLDWILSTLNTRLNDRKTALSSLQKAVEDSENKPKNKHSIIGTIINFLIIGILIIVCALWIIKVMKKRKKEENDDRNLIQVQPHQDADPNNPAIIVRRKTTSILKKQSIDDIINNPEYLLINSSEFTQESSVRNIYIKNTCIKDVYNLYAEDLRNSNNPKEDGCMVLGRWVHNENDNTYDISLETVVFPGDDAVFKEYELNFGGKIKLRVAEKLKKLRRETDLQYDLVCWIHSHPGLGVFFSNSDDNVQMQLKHSQHPHFLIAFVVDILTSDQEMGIFTFRKDGTMNSKGDLTKMYSLEEMYKWALESVKASFNSENYHNILASAKMRLPLCAGIELNNNSIIDLTQIVIEPATGIVGWAVGTNIEANEGKEYVVSNIVKADEKPSAGVIGVLLNVTHMSLPTIQRLIANENAIPSFVLVYSSRQKTLTSIPVINGELLTDENFYGEETIDDLKIWTRRKR